MSKKVGREEEVPEETEREEVEPQKPEKPAREEKKKEDKGVYTLYKIENGKVIRLRPTCERCGSGYFMADHGDRYTCGHCGFTRYKRSEK